MSSTDIQKSEPVTFDSYTMKIDADHIIACAGFILLYILDRKRWQVFVGWKSA